MSVDRISTAANCSKSTLYTYFDSKEDLYLSLAMEALESLMDTSYRRSVTKAGKSGLERSRLVFNDYIVFCQEHPDYYQLLLDYMGFITSIRNSEESNRLTSVLEKSISFHKMKDLQNIPINAVISEIKLGQKDGSIKNMNQPEMIFLTIWSLLVGYMKFMALSGPRNTLLKVDLTVWGHSILQLIDSILLNDSIAIDTDLDS